MNRSRKMLAALAAAVLLVPAAAVTVLTGSASADADGKHRHDLDTYKRESWHEIKAGAHLHEHMYCDAGDVALDGMWKVDAYDGDDRVVRGFRSFPDAADVTEWHYELGNPGLGRAQVKLFITCLDDQTGERDGHHHDLTYNFAAGSGVTAPFAAGGGTYSLTCAAGQIPVSPGFKFSASFLPGVTPTAYGPVYRSWPTLDKLGWEFRFGPGVAGDVAPYLRCIDVATTSAGSPAHTHNIDADMIPGYVGQAEVLGAGEAIERSVSSRPHDEGNVGAFSIDDPTNVTYLGQDARGQVRTTRFWSTGAGDQDAQIAVWGFDKRTKKNS